MCSYGNADFSEKPISQKRLRKARGGSQFRECTAGEHSVFLPFAFSLSVRITENSSLRVGGLSRNDRTSQLAGTVPASPMRGWLFLELSQINFYQSQGPRVVGGGGEGGRGRG